MLKKWHKKLINQDCLRISTQSLLLTETHNLHVKLLLSNLNQIWNVFKISVIFPNMIFHENLFSHSGVITCGGRVRHDEAKKQTFVICSLECT